MNPSRSSSLVGLLLAGPALLTFETASLHAEDVIVTGCVASAFNGCPPSCPDQLGTAVLDSTASVAVPAGAGRSKTMYGVSTNASWAVTPILGTSTGAYRVYVSQGTAYNCPTDIHVTLVATDGCTLADTNSVTQSAIDTTAFQAGASLNVWTPVAIIHNSTDRPTIKFSWASGGCSRWYMDEVRFENIAAGAATPARITNLLAGNPLTLRGTGPVSRPFALLSSTDPARSLNQWIPEQTNTAGTGSFSFSIAPTAGNAKFFRVITQ